MRANHDELRMRARSLVNRWRLTYQIGTDELVNTAYLRLAGSPNLNWSGRAHFLANAAKVMRSALVDQTRRRKAFKRGRGACTVPLQESVLLVEDPGPDLTGLGRALDKLREIKPRSVQAIELRFWGGFSVRETSEILGISIPTVHRDWSFAKAWLCRNLNRADERFLRVTITAEEP